MTLSPSLRIFDGEAPTIVFTAEDGISDYPNTTLIKLDFERNILPQIMQILYEKQLQSLLVEGGQTLLQSMINENLWDEAFIEKGTIVLNNGVKAPVITASCEKQMQMGRTYLHYINPISKFLK